MSKVYPPSLSVSLQEKSPLIRCFSTHGCDTLEQVMAWSDNFSAYQKEFKRHKEFLNDTAIIRHRRAKRYGPKVLLCHDYKYNYCERDVDDKINQLGQMPFYIFPYWSLIDIFVYFTHKLLTIPPLEWIIACHQNGVACFGTMMIEHWSKYQLAIQEPQVDGKEFLSQLLGNMKLIDKFVDAMSNIQNLYKFDGWLINIESPIDSDKIPRMEYFLQTLKNRIRNLFNYGDEPQVIWYDSVIKTGELLWQNELNDSNKNFFEKSDGIFLNYIWNERNLLESRRKAQEFDKRHQPYNVYVGVDCYGRGCFGGGGLETYRAVKMILEHDLSVAIFAPGWTHESKLGNETLNLSHRGSSTVYREKLDEDGYSLDDEYRFWSRIAIDGLLLKCENALASLPLYTCFNIGYGLNYFLLGNSQSHDHNISLKRSWLNFEHHQLQPSFFKPNQIRNNHYKISITFDCPFNGGSSFRIDMFDWPLVSKAITLFRTRILIDLNQRSKFRYQIIYKHLNFESSLNRWIDENLRIRTMIDYKECTNEDLDSSILTYESCRKIRQIANVKRLILDDLQESFLKTETFHVNEWRSQQMIVDLNRHEQFPRKSSIILLAFRIQPYIRCDKGKIAPQQLFMDKINLGNPFTVYIGEFYFDHYDPRLDLLF